MKNYTEKTILIGCSMLLTLTLTIAPVWCTVEGDWDNEEGNENKTVPIKCYQCNSWNNESCAQLAQGSPYLQDCIGKYDGEQAFCRKTVQTIKNHAPRVIRSCGWKRHDHDCYHTDDDHHVENVCQCYTDACNSASRRHVALFTVLLAIISFLSPV